MMLTDRKRVELTLLSQMLTGSLLGAVDQERDPAARDALTRLREVLEETMAGVAEPARGKILRRSERAYEAVFAPLTEQESANPGKLALAGFYVLQHVHDAGYVVVGEESAMQGVLNLLLPALQPFADEPRVNASAEKQAARILAGYQRLGYFETVGGAS